MRTPGLARLLVAAVLTGGSAVAAFAQPAGQAAPTAAAPSEAVASRLPAAPTVASDAQRYAARETRNAAVADFQGGRSVLVIGGSTVVIVLLVVLLVVLL